MATYTLVSNPSTITLQNSSENTLVWNAVFNPTMKDINVATIEFRSGTGVAFNSCGQLAANGATLSTAGDKLVVSFTNRDGIAFKGTTGDVFRISF